MSCCDDCAKVKVSAAVSISTDAALMSFVGTAISLAITSWGRTFALQQGPYFAAGGPAYGSASEGFDPFGGAGTDGNEQVHTDDEGEGEDDDDYLDHLIIEHKSPEECTEYMCRGSRKPPCPEGQTRVLTGCVVITNNKTGKITILCSYKCIDDEPEGPSTFETPGGDDGGDGDGGGGINDDDGIL